MAAQPIMRQSLAAILEREGDLRVVAAAGSVPEALDAVASHRPDLVLLASRAATQAAVPDLCRRISLAQPGLGVVVLADSHDAVLLKDSVRAGARGYVVADDEVSELIRALRAVGQGESAFDAHGASVMVRCVCGETPERQHLTGREMEVLQLLAKGLSNREVSGRLYISESTAKFHVGSLMGKLAVRRRAEAVYAATQLGLL